MNSRLAMFTEHAIKSNKSKYDVLSNGVINRKTMSALMLHDT